MGALLLTALLGLVGCGGSRQTAATNPAATKAAATVTVVRTVTVEAPPLTAAERRARQARARAAAAARKKAAARAAAKAAAKARARAVAKKAAAAAKARARAAAKKAAAEAAAARKKEAATLAANAWHQGYASQDGNVYWKWRHAGICQSAASNGCWHLAVITRKGCPSYVGINVNEYRGSKKVGKVHMEQIFGIPAKTARIFELDANRRGPLTANNVKIACR